MTKNDRLFSLDLSISEYKWRWKIDEQREGESESEREKAKSLIFRRVASSLFRNSNRAESNLFSHSFGAFSFLFCDGSCLVLSFISSFFLHHIPSPFFQLRHPKVNSRHS